MTMHFLYTNDHEYISPKDGIGVVGISQHAEEALGDIVFVELPEVGRKVKQGEQVGVVESVKSASEMYAPASGEVLEVNETLNDKPELINEDNRGAGWIYKIKIDDEKELDNLHTMEEYKDYVNK